MRFLCADPLALLATAALAAPPSGLLDKTITTSFAVSIPARAADGSALNATRHVTKRDEIWSNRHRALAV
jgi:hypothetical protein